MSENIKKEGVSATASSQWTEVKSKQRHKPTSKSSNTAKFKGQCTGSMEGIVLTEHGGLHEFNEFKDRLANIGGSQYHPKVRLSIQDLKRFQSTDFLTDIAQPTRSEYTSTVGGVEIEDTLRKATLMEFYQLRLKEAARDLTKYNTDMQKVYSLAIGQIDTPTKELLKSKPEWELTDRSGDVIALLKMARDLCYQGNRTKIHTPTNVLRALRKLICCRQREMNNAEYAKAITDAYDVFTSLGGTFVCKALIKYELENFGKEYGMNTYEEYKQASADDRKPIVDAIQKSFLATIMVEGSDQDRSSLHKRLSEQYCLGHNQYPRNTTRAIEMLGEFKADDRKTTAKNKQQSRAKQPSLKPQQKDKVSGEVTNAFVNKGQESTGRQVLMKAIEDDEDFGDESHYHSFFMLAEDGVASIQRTPEEDEASTDSNSNTTGPSGQESDDDWEYWATHDADSPGIEEPRSEDDASESGSHIEPCMDTATPGADEENTMVPETAGVESIINKQTALTHKERINGLDLAYSTQQSYRFGISDVFYYSERAILLAHQHRGAVNPDWILLDSESSVNLITNPKMVTNIREADDDRFITIHCNAGVAQTNLWADLPGFGTVWFYEDGIANVLSLALITDMYRVTMDSSIDNALHVHKPDGTTRRFSRSSCDLYYTDMTEDSGTLLTITTASGNKENYSDLDRRRAEHAKRLQEIVGFPTERELTKVLNSKLWQNCEVTSRDVRLAEAMYGRNPTAIQGRSARKTSGHIREDRLPVPQDILDKYGENVSLHVDIFTVNGVRFFHTISRHIRFRTVRMINDATQETLLDCAKTVIGIYASRGFQVRQMYGDNQFSCLTNALVSNMGHAVEVHCVPAGQHEPTVERSIRTIKDSARCLFNHVPFKRLPKRCISELVSTAVFWLNCRTIGVSDNHAAREIMTGIPIDINRDAKFQFMEPILAHVDDTDNTMNPRATVCLYLRPTGTATGGFYAYNPQTGKVIHRQRGTATPLTQELVDRIAELAEKQHAVNGIVFGDADGLTTVQNWDGEGDDDAEDDTYEPEADDESVDSHLTGVVHDDPDDMNPQGHEVPDAEVADTNDPEHTVETDDNVEHNDNNSEQDAPDTTESEETDAIAEENDEDVTAETAGVPGRTGLRPTVRRTHNKFGAADGYEASTHTRSLFTHGYQTAARKLESDYNAILLATTAIEQYNNLDASQVTQQYGVKKGIKLFGEAGVNAVLKELKQFHDMGVGEVVNPDTLDRETISRALPYLMFLKRKRCGKIKGRGCADGRRQREFITKEESFSPTVSLHALMLSCVQDAVEGRDVATADIPGAFLQTDMPEGEDVYIRMDGTMAELLCRVDPKTYRPHLKIGKDGKKVLFTKARKAIYGTLRAALLFWENLSGKLSAWGFEMNPYDSCTMNKIINGKQCTIVWHVDDLKISHVDPNVVTSILDKLNEEFGKISPLTVTRGKVHDYVGMTIDYSEEGKVKFSMFDYIEDIIQNLPEDLRGEAVTPAADHLFQVNEEATKLEANLADTFHHYVAKLLFMSKRARPDIQTAVSFLCTRVKAPDVDDWKKLKRVMGYLTGTPFIPLVLGTDDSGNAYWHVDAAFAVHDNMRSHTGGCLTFGTGTIIGNSLKQKLNTTSSTEAEVVGVHDNMPYICWVRYFLTAQQQHMTDNAPQESGAPGIFKNTILYQDNTSAMRLERNGKSSSTKRTRHIHIRYFFITDKVKNGEVTIEYCPTDEMVADYFTKPLQGSKFRKFRNTIMGLTDASYIRYLQEYKTAKESRSAVPK